jgi:flagella basal body P-ring formation protein FlgA
MNSLGDIDLISLRTLSSRNPWRTRRLAPARLSRCFLMVIALAAALPQARAQATSATAPQSELVTARVARYIEEQTRGLPGKVQITVNALDERSRVAACDDLQLFLPAGTRLWGATSVGVRQRAVRPVRTL